MSAAYEALRNRAVFQSHGADAPGAVLVGSLTGAGDGQGEEVIAGVVMTPIRPAAVPDGKNDGTSVRNREAWR